MLEKTLSLFGRISLGLILVPALNAQQKPGLPRNEWIEVVPERKPLSEAKRIRTIEDRLVLEVVLVREPNFFGKDVIHANGHVSNPTKKKLKGDYYVALFDKDRNLIACQGLSMADGLNPGEKGHNLSVVIEAPSSELDKVRLAQYRWYVSDSGN